MFMPVGTRGTVKGLTPFILSALNGQTQVAEFLKEKGADVFQKTKEGQNALMLTSFVSQMSRSGELRKYREVKYMSMIRHKSLGKEESDAIKAM
jgi:ankyrin repeat protein